MKQDESNIKPVWETKGKGLLFPKAIETDFNPIIITEEKESDEKDGD